jgi:hypothetical protein
VAAFGDCDGTFFPDSPCRNICPGGDLPGCFFNEELVPTIDGTTTTTCLDLQESALLGGLDKDICSWNHYMGTRFCGCDRVQPTCDICESGHEINLDGQSSTNFTCLEIAYDFVSREVVPGDDECPAWQANASGCC